MSAFCQLICSELSEGKRGNFPLAPTGMDVNYSRESLRRFMSHKRLVVTVLEGSISSQMKFA